MSFVAHAFTLQRILAELGLPIDTVGINGARTHAQHALSPPHQRHAAPSLPTGGGSSSGSGRDSADAIAAMSGISAVTTLPASMHVPSWAEGLGSQGAECFSD